MYKIFILVIFIWLVFKTMYIFVQMTYITWLVKNKTTSNWPLALNYDNHVITFLKLLYFIKTCFPTNHFSLTFHATCSSIWCNSLQNLIANWRSNTWNLSRCWSKHLSHKIFIYFILFREESPRSLSVVSSVY